MRKRLRTPSPAFVVSMIALFVALGGTTYAATSLPRNSVGSKQLKKGAVTPAKVAKKTIALFKGKTGPQGPKGDPGAKGATGSQGPGGTILNYNATAKASPTIKTLGTVLGDTIGASCSTTAGDAQLHVWLKTTDGSWGWDNSYIAALDSTYEQNASSVTAPVGIYSASTNVITYGAAAGTHSYNIQLEFVQFAPLPGSMIWHATAVTNNSVQTCHMTVQSFPEAMTAVAGLIHANPKAATTSASTALGGR